MSRSLDVVSLSGEEYDELMSLAEEYRYLLANHVYECSDYGDLELRYRADHEHFNNIRASINARINNC